MEDEYITDIHVDGEIHGKGFQIDIDELVKIHGKGLKLNLEMYNFHDDITLDIELLRKK